MKRIIALSGQKIEYSVEFKDIRHIIIKIDRALILKISAPKGVGIFQIEQFIYQKSKWIVSKLKMQEAQGGSKSELNFVSGEKVSLLGEIYPLEVISSKKKSAYLQNKTLYICVDDVENGELKKGVFKKFLYDQALFVYPKVLNNAFTVASRYGIEMPSLKIRFMKSRWGSCLPMKKIVTLSTHLIHFEDSLIEYVVMHELAHLRHANHSKDYYQFLTTLMPDWHERRERLNKLAGGIDLQE
ncbi:MAG: SprT family zinc-dependent metalloprotease [Fusobacteria bacterium]|nr:SprT family zinc-dependent metalloprotease [Fusobacteriota bacterium]